MKVSSIKLSDNTANKKVYKNENNSKQINFGHKLNTAARPTITTIAKNIGNELKTLARKFAVPLLPIVPVALLAATSYIGARNANLNTYLNQALNKLQRMHDDGKLTDREYKDKVQEFKEYYSDAKKLNSDYSSSDIKKGEPSFKADDSDVSTTDTDDDCCDSDDDCCDSDDDCCDSDGECCNSGDATTCCLSS